MDSGVFGQVFSSWEVIATSLILILMLPLVFFVASTKARKRKPVRLSPPRSKAKPAVVAAKKADADEEVPAPRGGRPSRSIEPPDEAEDRS